MSRRIKPQHGGIFASTPCLGIICGKTGRGKTYLLMKALLAEGLLDYDSLYIYTSTPEQAAYQFLKNGFANHLSRAAIGYLFHAYEEDDTIDSSVSDFCDAFRDDNQMREKNKDKKVTVNLSSKALPMPESLDKTKKHVIIFDDCVNQRDQSLQKEYYTRGRHMNCTVFYLTQRYYDVPKIIRDNSNLMILFKQPHKSLTLLFNELDAENSDKMKLIARESWKSKYSYIAINTAFDENNITTNIFDKEDDEEDMEDE